MALGQSFPFKLTRKEENPEKSGNDLFDFDKYMSNMSFSGADAVATIIVPVIGPTGNVEDQGDIINLGELQTISYSIHRENSPIRTLGHVNVRGFVKGGRTIAGSLIFTVFNEYAFYRIKQFREYLARKQGFFAPLADMLPPFDIVITFFNEYGIGAKMKIFGVTIVDEGQTLSIDDLITEQTYCVDEETEALTKAGWKRYVDITDEDEFLTLNIETKNIEWSSGNLHTFDYDGPMVHWSNTRGVDAVTTPNHRWVTSSQYQMEQHGYERAKFAFNETDSILPSHHIVVAGGISQAFANDPTFSNELVEVIGWTITEGSICYNQYKVPYGIQIPQSELANPKNVEKLRRLVDHFKAQGSTASVSEINSIGCRTFYFGKGIGKIIGEIVTTEKTLTPEFLSLLTYSQAILLKEVLLDGDGHRAVLRGENAKISTPYFIQNPGPRTDAYQMLMSMLGVRTSAKTKGSNGGCITSYNSNIIANYQIDNISYSGIVWCPTTQNGTWMARRNGNTFWTGNTYMARGIQPLMKMPNESLVPRDATYTEEMRSRDMNIGSNIFGDLIVEELALLNEKEYYEDKYNPMKNENNTTQVQPPR